MTTDRFQILSLDGGGLRGMYTAAVLARLEEDLGIRIVDHFDLIAGTSTGGIIALGLGLGMTPREILEFYTAHGPRIFRDRTRLRSLRRISRTKYSAAPLRAPTGHRRSVVRAQHEIAADYSTTSVSTTFICSARHTWQRWSGTGARKPSMLPWPPLPRPRISPARRSTVRA
jgi:patatin-like phospholipase/acyl hydrolase